MSRAAVLESDGEARTQALGAALGALLRGGDVVALFGPLGSGKTRFVQGLALGLGVPADEDVVSPTFVLVREYVGRVRLCHLDAYRLTGPAELHDLGFGELIGDGSTVVALEWADRVGGLVPASACRVELAHAGEQRRRIAVRWPDAARLAQLVEAASAG